MAAFLLLNITTATQAQTTSLTPLSILTQDGQQHVFRVDVAQTDEMHRRGLMHRKEMSHDQGMLFIYNKPRIVRMWMKNTHIPLDIIFIKPDGTIANILRHTEPLSLETISSSEPCIAALEVNAGISEKLAIQAGDAVLHSRLSQILSALE